MLDTDTWERSSSFTLEASDNVVFYARNDDGGTSHLGFGIPYEFFGQSHLFYPDFLVRLKDGTTLILEIKGMMGEQEEAKFQAAKRWVSAVNNWGRMGRWHFHVCRDPQMLARELAHLGSRRPGVVTASELSIALNGQAMTPPSLYPKAIAHHALVPLILKTLLSFC